MNISETISEKPKRGRPRSLSPEAEAAYRQTFAGKGERTIQNRSRLFRALRALGLSNNSDADAPADGGNYAYLWDEVAINAGENGGRMTILAELGRVEDGETLRLLADRICAERMPTSKALALIRRIRLGATDAPPDRLDRVLLAAVDLHVARYPATTKADVRDAVLELLDVIRDSPLADGDD